MAGLEVIGGVGVAQAVVLPGAAAEAGAVTQGGKVCVQVFGGGDEV